MATEYYYIRLAAWDEKADKEGVSSWIPCSKARALKRFKAARETESFNNYVVTVTETETEITIRDIETRGERGERFAELTLNKEYIFGSPTKAERAQAVLRIFEEILDTCVSMATAQ